MNTRSVNVYEHLYTSFNAINSKALLYSAHYYTGIGRQYTTHIIIVLHHFNCTA